MSQTHRSSILLFAAIASLLLPYSAHAAGNATAKVMLHALSRTTKNTCNRPANIPASCSSYDAGINNLALYPSNYFAYLLVVQGSQVQGVAGVACGIDYEGGVNPVGGFTPISVYDWTLCATQEMPSASPAWPSPGSENSITWNAPSTQCTAPPGNATIGAVGVAGYFYMAAYAPTKFRITPRASDNLVTVTNCLGQVDQIYVLDDPNCTYIGSLGFGMSGHNPCNVGNSIACTPRPTCTVDGPSQVTAGQSGIEFYSDIGFGDAQTWTISGNGAFEGPTFNRSTVHVTAGGPGQFTVRTTFTGPHLNTSCQRTVTVQDPVATTPASWGRIKTLMN